jgi:hypothetical protein
VDQDDTMHAEVTTANSLGALFWISRSAQPDTTPASSTPEGPDGVHLIHTIPSGIACVYDQRVHVMLSGETLEDVLRDQYTNVDVVQALAEENDLTPNADGVVSAYVPPGDSVVIPEMCYPKSGAPSVTLASTGVPEDSAGGASINPIVVIALILIAIVVWKWVSARVIKVR